MSNSNEAYIKIPRSFTMEYSQINSILNQLARIEDSNVNAIGLDFTVTSFFSAELSTFLGIIIQYLQGRGYKLFTINLKTDSKVGKILSKNEFLKLIMDRDPIRDTYNSTIKYVKVNSDNINSINSYLENNFIPKFESTVRINDLNRELEESFKDSIFEFSDNISAHSHSKYLYMCGQYFHNNKELKMAIADMGITIPRNLREHQVLLDKVGDEEYINWAMQKGNSTKEIPQSGMGLNEIKEAMKRLGHMTIVSNRGYWKQNYDGTIQKKLLSEPFPGTLLHMNILLDKSNYYENDILNIFENNDELVF
ncbi:hypothetical protein ACFQAV_05735 [Companilactobacillus huachuanensis]|uniref:STAS domain-containing protein n=1 Tax=Companilactobacillus huachuanensis TaxID=2559914 RepID=A0ABW1RN30_9LACO|nr:hypothetical protein [Companilactobacillus huachuanensis]